MPLFIFGIVQLILVLMQEPLGKSDPLLPLCSFSLWRAKQALHTHFQGRRRICIQGSERPAPLLLNIPGVGSAGEEESSQVERCTGDESGSRV